MDDEGRLVDGPEGKGGAAGTSPATHRCRSP
jgi:hypothetical protein